MTRPRKPVPHARGVKLPTQPCRCHYQSEQTWGYQVFRWTGKQWKSVDQCKSIIGAVETGERLKCMLIVCRGCGQEMHRDPFPTVKILLAPAPML